MQEGFSHAGGQVGRAGSEYASAAKYEAHTVRKNVASGGVYRMSGGVQVSTPADAGRGLTIRGDPATTIPAPVAPRNSDLFKSEASLKKKNAPRFR
jgi:type IV secretory pathway TrbL component